MCYKVWWPDTLQFRIQWNVPIILARVINNVPLDCGLQYGKNYVLLIFMYPRMPSRVSHE